MPVLQFTFGHELNVSAQVGDIAYYVPTNTVGKFSVNSSDVIEIGPITYINISSKEFWCSSTLASSQYPSREDYIFIAKDNKANQSNVLGYYAQVDLFNNSKEKAEIFSVNADYFESSK